MWPDRAKMEELGKLSKLPIVDYSLKGFVVSLKRSKKIKERSDECE